MKWSRDELVKIDFSDGKVTQITYEGGVWPHPAADGYCATRHPRWLATWFGLILKRGRRSR